MSPRTRELHRLNRLSAEIIDAAIRIHTRLGPGLLESIYESILARDLARRGLRVERQKAISFEFEGLRFENACRADLVVEESVVVEVKATSSEASVHRRQLMTYLRLLDCCLGLILNFGAPLMKDGISRVINGY